MDLRQLEYIVKIAEENNITRAAEKLFITQSALNQQLLRLEKELGTPFYSVRPTGAPRRPGMVYLENARKILQIKHQTYSIISDMAATKRPPVSGLYPGRGIDMFTAVYPAFHSQYPNIIICEPKEMSVHQQQQQISQGNLDIGFMTLQESDQTGDVYEIIRREKNLCWPSLRAIPWALWRLRPENLWPFWNCPACSMSLSSLCTRNPPAAG